MILWLQVNETESYPKCTQNAMKAARRAPKQKKSKNKSIKGR